MADKNFKVKNGLEVGDRNIVTPDGTITLPTGTKTLAPTDSPTFTGTVGLPSTTSIGNISSTELGYLDGVTSAIQTQLNAKAPLASPTFTGTVTLPSTTSIGSVSSTELGYLDGVTSAIQTQLNSKSSSTVSINTQTGTSYTLALSDSNKLVEMNNAAANTLTVPPNSSVAFPTGTKIDIVQIGAGQTTIAEGSGVTINSKDGNVNLTGQWSAVSVVKRGTDEWTLIGDLSA